MRRSSNLLIAVALLVLVPATARAQAVPTNLVANGANLVANGFATQCRLVPPSIRVFSSATAQNPDVLPPGSNYTLSLTLTDTVTIGPFVPDPCQEPPSSRSWLLTALDNVRSALRSFIFR
jgi:hypothetical protein